MNLAAKNSDVTVSSAGIILQGAGGTGPGTINLSGYGATVWLQGTQKLDNATVKFSAGDAYLEQINPDGHTLTLGVNLTVLDNIAASSGAQGIGSYALVNKGTIVINSATALFYISGEYFTNYSAVNVSAGVLDVYTSTASNAGQITVSGGSVLNVGIGDLNNSGTLDIAGGSVTVSGNLSGTAAGLIRVDAGGSQADATVSSQVTVTFNGANAILALKKAGNFAGTIAGFGATDSIDLLRTVATAERQRP